MSSGPSYTIGEFSMMSGIPVRTLRFYHEERLLIPAAVDRQTGYRSYDDRNLEIARSLPHYDRSNSLWMTSGTFSTTAVTTPTFWVTWSGSENHLLRSFITIAIS